MTGSLRETVQKMPSFSLPSSAKTITKSPPIYLYRVPEGCGNRMVFGELFWFPGRCLVGRGCEAWLWGGCGGRDLEPRPLPRRKRLHLTEAFVAFLLILRGGCLLGLHGRGHSTPFSLRRPGEGLEKVPARPSEPRLQKMLL